MGGDKFTRERDSMLRAHGFELVRSTGHQVFRNPDGRTVTFAATPSDWRTARKQLTDVRRALRDKQRDTTIDTTVPKQQRHAAGQAGMPAVPFRVYRGPAPASRKASTDELVKSLKGFRASRDAYRFKSEFVQCVIAILEANAGRCCEVGKALLLRFDEIHALFLRLGGLACYDNTAPLEALDKETLDCLSVFHAGWEDAVESLGESEGDLLRLTRAVIRFRIDQFSRYGVGSWTRRTMGRLANRLWRGDSAEQVKEFLAEQGFDDEWLTQVIEDLAAERIEDVSRT